MAAIGKVSLRGIVHEDSQYVFLAASSVAVTDEGMAVTLDTSAANTVKLAGDGDAILGQLVKYEDRVAEGVKVCTVAIAGGMRFPVNPNATASSPDETPAVGDFLEGGTKTSGSVKGYVQKAQTAALVKSKFQVVETETISGAAYVVAISI